MFNRKRNSAQPRTSAELVDQGLVSIYRRPDAYFVIPKVRTTAGVWVLPVGIEATTVPVDVAAETLGAVVLTAAGPAARVVSHPAQHEWTEHRRATLGPLQKQAGVRSWRAFEANAKLVEVGRIESRYTVTAMRRDRQRLDAWVEGDKITLESPAADVIGAAVISSASS